VLKIRDGGEDHLGGVIVLDFVIDSGKGLGVGYDLGLFFVEGHPAVFVGGEEVGEIVVFVGDWGDCSMRPR
jgi:hypothetical protein